MAHAYGAQGPLVMGITWTEAALAITLVALRAKAAFSTDKSLGWDTIWVIFALILALTAQSLMTVSAVYGLGNHQRALSPMEIVRTNLWSWMAQVVAILCLVVARFAVMALLLRTQGQANDRAHRIGRRLIYAVGILQAVINVVEVILILQQCDPVQKLWDGAVPGTCSLIKICSLVGYFQGSVGVLADLLLVGYAYFIIIPLQMKIRAKIAVCVLMSGSIITAVAAICKTIAISSITKTTDLTYAIHTLNTWVLTEMWFIIIFGSIPPLRVFFMRLVKNMTTAPGCSSERNSRKGHMQADEQGKKEWMQLHERSSEACITTCAPSAEATDTTSNAGSEEGIIPKRVPSGQIKVTMTTQVHKEIC